MYNIPDQAQQNVNNQPPHYPYVSQPYGYPSNPALAQAMKPKRRHRWVWFVSGGFVVLLLACGIGGFALLNYANHNPVTDTVNQYYTSVKSQNYNAAYASLDAQGMTYGNAPLTQQLYNQAGQALDTQKGKVSAYSITSMQAATNNGVSTASYTVHVTRGNQSYDTHLQLRQETSNWKIVSIDNI